MLKARVLTALVLVVLLLAALFGLSMLAWACLIAFIAAAAAWEWAGLATLGRRAGAVYAVITLAVCLAMTATVFGWPPSEVLARVDILRAVYGIALAFWVAVVPYWLIRRVAPRGGLRAAAVGWLVLVPASQAMIHVREVGPLVLLVAMSLVWVADIAAYFAGRAFGRHKLAPEISPGKTWEGALGAVVAVVCYGLLMSTVSAAWPTSIVGAAGLTLGLIVLTAVSIIGDLFESMLKRHAGVKDSGHLLPGHGGILDRIDSLTSTLPLFGMSMLLWGR